jgi:hypothetical protein
MTVAMTNAFAFRLTVVASIILGGTILAPIQFGFAAGSDNNPSAAKEESEAYDNKHFQ